MISYRRLCQNERGDIVVESVRQSRPVAKTPSAHADVQTHVPGVLFRRGHVRNLLRLREGEGQEEDALKKRRGVKELSFEMGFRIIIPFNNLYRIIYTYLGGTAATTLTTPKKKKKKKKKRDRVACTFTATGDVYSYYVLKSPDVHSFVVKATRDESFFVFVFFIFVPVAHKCPVATVDDFIVVVAIAVRSYR